MWSWLTLLNPLWPHLWPGGTWWSGFDAIYPNIAASLIIGPVVWFWKVRPHFRRQRAHREHVAAQLADLHVKADAAAVNPDSTP